MLDLNGQSANLEANEAQSADNAVKILPSYLAGKWQTSNQDLRTVYHAITGEAIYQVSSHGCDMKAAVEFAKKNGSQIASWTFHERANALKQVASYLLERKEEFYSLAKATGCTRKDAWIDVEGGFGTLFAYSSLVRRELSNETALVEDAWIPLSKQGNFGAKHILTSKAGVAVHIDAFNFPIWGMLEKIAPTLLAGVPCIVKPATEGAEMTQAVVKHIVESGFLPDGALQLICGQTYDLFDHLGPQDTVTFTGSASTGQKLRAHPRFNQYSIPFSMEADSVNSAILTNNANEETIDLFVREVFREMTTKAGQKCTAIRRAFVPAHLLEQVQNKLISKLQKVVVGNPELENVTMGALASVKQKHDVAEKVELLSQDAQIVVGGHLADFKVEGADANKGAFYPATLLVCTEPTQAKYIHQVEAFGPVSTLMPYQNLQELADLVARGEGSLVASIVRNTDDNVEELVAKIAPWHGRLHILDASNAKESTGHGSPLPHLVHGGPGRAGGGEELGGIRAVKHYMQRTAIQGSPNVMTQIGHSWTAGAEFFEDRVHPFKKSFDELRVGERLLTARRTVTEADIVNFACLSGDHFYAHMDKIGAENSFFGERVAHGYFIVSAAAGLFVDAAPGPVIANYGMDNLRFVEPVKIGDTIQVELTCKQKTPKPLKDPEQKAHGVVVWDIKVKNQRGELVATYDILTLVERA
ncbi:phenylacetic acid degradation bifunctional protein PaaZ [Acinetobacter gerneri]|uniref:Phenylacetic acid degradation bifunctional protein PaaZ n=1 Tax=Acinetobacter gerneri TaxID=202952 RepID=A0AAW8JIJ4_9GAMM|nr:phenylacetic acid degradation bifunctional protein PaaZ [Acinetobacter gerneri]MDQ9009603.1 phenylacetic acid degradation bifunctional protein PaaZ [Acinetobacter gerneri]MDQ9013801.1 phenylacetic acid degradation bifunctional protein PaaZ [Acinetobacter gerneri]MDQ9024969.1 phenylacetic acid degradation bifunctional protein PaaZ [Acinetobacter gerneri]MDQ9052271.1 phenylacetic acid degradation bifunctional protein PaaZ [Acinetobacter gerneri]MDQ9059650.1 phenylacetic acid degradation bifun